jgi:cold shock protein
VAEGMGNGSTSARATGSSLTTVAYPGVFLHKSAIEAGGYRNLQDSQRVAYTVARGAKGPQAEHG